MPVINTSSIIRLSISSDGLEGNDGSYVGTLSPDGRFVAFYSYASNFFSSDTTGSPDIFLRDTLSGTTRRVMVGYDGSAPNSTSFTLSRNSLSDDGRFVAFSSYASNLIRDDTNGQADIFVRDMQSGTTVRLSQASDGTAGDAYSGNVHLTGDGRFAAFESSASNLMATDANGFQDIFVRDLLTGEMRLASLSNGGAQGNSSSYLYDISSDGRFVTFQSYASNLVGSGDTNGMDDIFLRDMVLGTTTRLSVGNGGVQSNGSSYYAGASDDGRYAAFSSAATNLITGDTNGLTDVFLRDTVAGTTTMLSVSSAGVRGNGASYFSDISADGRYVVFYSSASNLVADDTNGLTDVFLRDTVAGTTTRLSVGLGGAQANDYSYDARISADGSYVTFYSNATNLAAGDSNSRTDVFRVSLFASNSADYLFGTDGADTIAALAGSDVINGGAGNDLINGGAGIDTMDGGSGDDTYFVDNAGDVIVEAAGTAGGTADRVAASVSYTLRAGVAVEQLITSYSAGTGALFLTGNEFAQAIAGNAGANRLYGAGGNDTLTGGGGDDRFYFTTAPNTATNRDTITDFSNASGNNDSIYLSRTVFAALTGASGAVLSASQFATNTTGVGSGDRHIIYNTATGALFYDANTGDTAAGVQFAQLGTAASHPSGITSADFFLV